MRSTATRLQRSMLCRVVKTYSPRDAVPNVQKPAAASVTSADKTPPNNPPRTLVSPYVLNQRIGKCLAFGCDAEQTHRAASLLRIINKDWRNLEAAVQGFHDPKNSVYTTRLRAGEPSHRPWRGISQVSPLVQIAEQSIARFLDRILKTAKPQYRRKWELLRDNHIDGCALSITECLNEQFPNGRPFPSRSLEPQVVSAYTKLKSNDYNKNGTFRFKIVIFSHKHLMRIADLNLNLKHYTPHGRPLGWLSQEMKRVSLLTGTDAAFSSAYNHAKSIEKMIKDLEKGTWRRPDATEDFGTAAP
ncbi:hypothetical protein BDP81DRAFT_390035 [Colletotrichum phormii]|uniref:Uncharacterized protein n=1 Tax=Colletotrichum phormii TaxID=359342 RepID=A0AAJ0A314_9PEZI|nr:uncharacterized protein BDP81DRAFT_390035 [Colletotrichum phormii]KAK1655043.1 hypothetical protein BDP81DRAFT_390035 [Colletotrichum phormii]